MNEAIKAIVDMLERAIAYLEVFAPDSLHESLTAAAQRRAERVADEAERLKGLT